MYKKTTAILLIALLTLSTLSIIQLAQANTVPSSTIEFEGTLTYDSGSGTYSGIIPCIEDGGFDIYGEEGDNAWFGDDPGSGPVWTSQTISSHDAWPTWTPDTPDWYQYSLRFYEDGGTQKWALRNHPGATEANPWYDSAFWGAEKPAMGVPMSGTMDWVRMYATETDVGAYLPETGTPEIPGGAASYGGGSQHWDMDWSWGSESVPLQYPGFVVEITDVGSGNYHVTMTPAPLSSVGLSAEAGGWTITTNIVGLGTVTPSSPGPYPDGTTVTLTATPDENWQFSTWGGDASGTSLTTDVYMDENKNVDATFVLDVISISVSPTTIDFGEVIMNTVSDPETVTITNTGNVDVYVDATVQGAFFGSYLRIDGGSVAGFGTTISEAGFDDVDLTIDLTGVSSTGSYDGTLIFWAEET